MREEIVLAEAAVEVETFFQYVSVDYSVEQAHSLLSA